MVCYIHVNCLFCDDRYPWSLKSIIEKILCNSWQSASLYLISQFSFQLTLHAVQPPWEQHIHPWTQHLSPVLPSNLSVPIPGRLRSYVRLQQFLGPDGPPAKNTPPDAADDGASGAEPIALQTQLSVHGQTDPGDAPVPDIL